jgi:hypothetical protein
MKRRNQDVSLKSKKPDNLFSNADYSRFRNFAFRAPNKGNIKSRLAVCRSTKRVVAIAVKVTWL